jgi:hypothetical protein
MTRVFGSVTDARLQRVTRRTSWPRVALHVLGSAGILLGSFLGTLSILDNFSATYKKSAIVVLKNVSTLGDPITGVTARIAGDWCPNGTSIAPAFPLPAAQVVYGSHCAAGDPGKGKLLLDNLPDTARAIDIPIIVGPSSKGLYLSVIDKVSGEIVRQVYLDTLSLENAKWQTLMLSAPNGRKWSQFRIDATDAGSEWGQWFGISMPYNAK